MLTLDSAGGPKNNNVEPSWKVLVYDKTGEHGLILVKIIMKTTYCYWGG